mgnify:CR=1 FL=1
MPDDGSNSMMMMIMMAWLFIAAFLFLFRPSSLRAQLGPKARQGNVSMIPLPTYKVFNVVSLLQSVEVIAAYSKLSL